MRIGLYLHEMPGQWGALAYWEEQLDLKIDMVSIYQAWGSEYRDFDAEHVRRIQEAGKTPLITWEPWEIPRPGSKPEGQPKYRLIEILAGKYDAYIESWVKKIASLEAPLLLRPMHEMNGDWYPWCGTVNGNRVEEYVAVWKYLYDFFNAYVPPGVIQWVWSPYAFSKPDINKNAISKYFPGDDFVDWIALDGYNWGTCKPGFSWEGFEEIFTSAYGKATRLSDKPVMIGETASTEKGGDKAAWIKGAFEVMEEKFPRIQGLVWFNVKKECDWQLDSSKTALDAFKAGLRIYGAKDLS